jgi:hypothetical protein
MIVGIEHIIQDTDLVSLQPQLFLRAPGRVVPELFADNKISGCSSPTYKIYLHKTYRLPTIFFKSSLGYL